MNPHRYEAEFACGHAETVHLPGPPSEDQIRLRWWAAGGLCSECQTEATRKQQMEESLRARSQALRRQLPLLLGTHRQIEWAIVIRQRLIDRWAELEHLAGREHRVSANQYAAITSVWEELLACTRAWEWIELRFVSRSTEKFYHYLHYQMEKKFSHAEVA